MPRRVYIASALLIAISAFCAAEENARFLILVPNSIASSALLYLEQLDHEFDFLVGVELDVEFFTSHPQALARLLRGEAQALLTGTSQGWENHLDGGPVVMVNTGIWGVSSMISIDEFEPTEIKGKRVALPFPGSPLDVQMRYIWRRQGIDPDEDIELSYSPPPQTVARLVSGRIDAAPLPEPIATELVVTKGLHRAFEIATVWAEVNNDDRYSPQVSLFTTNDSGNSATIATLVELWREASFAITDDPAYFAPIFAPLFGRTVPVVSEALRRTIFRVPSMQENERRVRAYFDIVRSVYPTERPGLSDEFFPEF